MIKISKQAIMKYLEFRSKNRIMIQTGVILEIPKDYTNF